jgi:hypothetical protein
MKNFLEGIKCYIIGALLVSCVLIVCSTIMLFLFGSNNPNFQTISDVLNVFIVRFFATGSLLGAASWKWHLVLMFMMSFFSCVTEWR